MGGHMNRTMQLELPEDLYASLVEAAEKAGQKPEAVAVQWLTVAANKDRPYDPLEQFIDAFESPPEYRDWADNHDKYLGENLYREMRGNGDGEDA